MEKTSIANHTLTKSPLLSYEETVSQIFRLAREYYRDLIPYTKFKPQEFFTVIQKMPYVRDPEGIEFINRPKISLALAGTGHPFDCDDRAVLSLAYFKALNEVNAIFGRVEQYETRIVVTGRRSLPHHVYIEYRQIGNPEWIPFDPTYPQNKYGVELFQPGFKKTFTE